VLAATEYFAWVGSGSCGHVVLLSSPEVEEGIVLDGVGEVAPKLKAGGMSNGGNGGSSSVGTMRCMPTNDSSSVSLNVSHFVAGLLTGRRSERGDSEGVPPKVVMTTGGALVGAGAFAANKAWLFASSSRIFSFKRWFSSWQALSSKNKESTILRKCELAVCNSSMMTLSSLASFFVSGEDGSGLPE